MNGAAYPWAIFFLAYGRNKHERYPYDGMVYHESLRGQSKKLQCKIIGAWLFSIAVVITLACISMVRYKGKRRATFCAWASGASIMIVNLFPIKDMVQIARKSKSLKDMPLHASIFGLLSAIPWVVYGMRKKDLSTSVPNFTGIFVSGIQISWHIRSCRIKNVKSPRAASHRNATSRIRRMATS
ncbi:hypothetical protein MRB53_015117 [Persea americana]|uniref:Uncharacterized protein n=1 Tax=Persea americana TaxID=3435 RepID=A0ACC2KCW4_PERAE|nr:hypothetical protein MRB53_015117 [Persea americana]